jgi:hypothetical protein
MEGAVMGPVATLVEVLLVLLEVLLVLELELLELELLEPAPAPPGELLLHAAIPDVQRARLAPRTSEFSVTEGWRFIVLQK